MLGLNDDQLESVSVLSWWNMLKPCKLTLAFGLDSRYHCAQKLPAE